MWYTWASRNRATVVLIRGLSCYSLIENTSFGATQKLSTHPLRERTLVCEREDIEGYEESVQQLVCQNRAEAVQPQTQDVLDIVEMVQMLCHQFLQSTSIQMAARRETHTLPSLVKEKANWAWDSRHSSSSIT